MRIFLLLIFLLSFTQTSYSLSWKNLWKTSDQQAVKALNAKDAKGAAKLFYDQTWRGVAQYQSGDYQHAQKSFSNKKSALDNYNRGNALAKQGNYQAALDAYNDSLKINTHDEDAKFNRELIKKLLKQQKKKQSSNKQKKKRQSKKNQPPKQQNQSQKKPDDKKQPAKQDKKKKPEQHAQNKHKPKTDKNTKQWLRNVPEDPGGLLRHKFLRDYENRLNGKK